MLSRLRAQWRVLQHDSRGATAIEYAMMAVFIGILLIAAMESIGSSVSDFFLAIGSGL